MPTVADVLRRHGPAYLERFGTAMPAEHKKVLAAITACRTGQLGTVIYQCAACGTTHAMGRSCGNRHCPTCQQDKAKAWLENQIDRLLPCPYFLLTFTVPAGLRGFVRRHQRVAYAAIFEASSAAIKTLAADPKYVGTPRCGFFGVLHTWGRTLDYHPHVHYVVPGGGISPDGSQWLASRADFFVPVKALSILFRAKFRDALDRAGLLRQVDPVVWRQDWVVHSQAVGDGQASLKYLAPYVFRVAIKRPEDRGMRGRQGDLLVSPERLEPLAKDDRRWVGVHPPIPATRIADRFPQGSALWLPESQQPDVDRRRAMADYVAALVDV
jgi:hypothetical protein